MYGRVRDEVWYPFAKTQLQTRYRQVVLDVRRHFKTGVKMCIYLHILVFLQQR